MDYYANGQTFYQKSGNFDWAQQNSKRVKLDCNDVVNPADYEPISPTAFVNPNYNSGFTPILYKEDKSTRFVFVSIKSDHESAFQLFIDLSWKVDQAKKAIQELVHTPSAQQHLFYQDIQLVNDQILSNYNIEDGSEILLVIVESDEDQALFDSIEDQAKILFNPNFFETKFNADYTNVQEDKITYTRGGYPYKRPLGAIRYGLKVHGRYLPDNKWLGTPGGHRTKSDDGEWAVAYHGTKEMNASAILQEGFKLEKCIRAAFGQGIYCTPDPKTALSYAIGFEFQGSQCRAVLQCRVNPHGFKVVRPGSTTDGDGDYWLLTNSADIRPYGLCIYKNDDLQRNRYNNPFLTRLSVPRPQIPPPLSTRTRTRKRQPTRRKTVPTVIASQNVPANTQPQPYTPYATTMPQPQNTLPNLPQPSINPWNNALPSVNPIMQPMYPYGLLDMLNQMLVCQQTNFSAQQQMPFVSYSSGRNDNNHLNQPTSSNFNQMGRLFTSSTGQLNNSFNHPNIQPNLVSNLNGLNQPCSSTSTCASFLQPSPFFWPAQNSVPQLQMQSGLMPSNHSLNLPFNNQPSVSSATAVDLSASQIANDFLQKIQTNDYLEAMFNLSNQITPKKSMTNGNGNNDAVDSNNRQNEIIDLTLDDDDDQLSAQPSLDTAPIVSNSSNSVQKTNPFDDSFDDLFDYIKGNSPPVTVMSNNGTENKLIDVIDLSSDDENDQVNRNASPSSVVVQHSPLNTPLNLSFYPFDFNDTF